MTKREAQALCQMLHVCLGEKRDPFYLTARLFGHDLTDSTCQLAECAWTTVAASERMSIKAAALFRDMAQALVDSK